MKKIHNLICLACIASPAIIPAISLTSCADEQTRYILTWNASDGEFVYDESIKLKEINDSHGDPKLVKWQEATSIYFEDIYKNPKIFVNDVMYVYVNRFQRMFAGSEDALLYGLPIPFKVKSITVAFNGCDVEEQRLSYEVEAKLSSVDLSEKGVGSFHLKIENEPYSMLYYADLTSGSGVINYGLYPAQVTDQFHYKFWEITDPLYPDCSAWNMMFSTYDGWRISLNEDYTMPKQFVGAWNYAFDWTNKTHRSDHNIIGWDDPELFDGLKYFYERLYIAGSHYFSKVLGEENEKF